MPCEAVEFEDGRRAILCSRSRRGRRKCHCCGAPATKECDFARAARAKTCDKPLCESCAVPVGENRDYCPEHPRLVSAEPQLAMAL